MLERVKLFKGKAQLALGTPNKRNDLLSRVKLSLYSKSLLLFFSTLVNINFLRKIIKYGNHLYICTELIIIRGS